MIKIFREHQKPEQRRFIHSLVLPIIMLVIMFSVRIIEDLEQWDLFFLGVKPLSLEGIPGIILSPFIHSGWQHLFNNAVSFFILSITLFYVYREIAYRVFFVIYILAGAWLWFGGRDSWHIGASGIVYGLTSFLFLSGVLRRYIPLLAISLFVAFLYGSLVWGMFPLAEKMPHSWEGHFWGFLAGISAAVVFRNEGPQKPPSPIDEDDDEDDDEIAYWNASENNDENNQK